MIGLDRQIEVVAICVTAVANLVTAGSIVLLRKSFHLQIKSLDEEYLWRQKNLSISVSREWNSFTSEYRDRLEKTFRDLYGEEPVGFYIKPIDNDLADRIFRCIPNERLSKDVLRELKTDITVLLNYFEYISIAYEKEALDRSIIDDLFQFSMTNWYSDLKGYMDYIERNIGRSGWLPYKKLALKWQSEREQHRHLS